uniref:ATP synthase F0 subunit 8 n=1 Tax=Frankliniella intonsa TaxID=163893 RepID=UPI00286CED95|nr:ATP synthase F0 subunit 8 [Frankliniella intonsa]WKD81342.1 ATP synthase F0 subunit 8 [Frankliniella intonsa]WKD81381.1 ATP synthase F0 subunit 8 [Frankliniella intonsa]WKD81394.1 ATP synthase F0 subunit 8 [Frankliniella intonsa]WKD81433.1 ATP synthase F0 subunit 8 [Frankliniella intonsa]WKD81498.1 ATP synthase F0 subunit 8 [Frankliniella intonsa]
MYKSPVTLKKIEMSRNMVNVSEDVFSINLSNFTDKPNYYFKRTIFFNINYIFHNILWIFYWKKKC